MCELLGMSFNQPVKPTLSFRGFRQRGEYNRDGWGIAFYPDKASQIFKEPKKATESELAQFISNYHEINSKLFIAHVRLGSKGKVAYMNTHPFSRELNGKDYTFAHNGTLSGFENLPTGRFCKIGCTDSEFIFCHILNCIKEKGIAQWTNDGFSWLAKKLIEINRLGRFNCVFSDGESLFCYYDQNGYNGLCLVHRRAPFDRVCLLDDDFEINLAEEKKSSQKGFIVATRRLTNERWENFSPGELIVFKNGDIMFSSSGRTTEQFLSPINEKELNVLRAIRQSPHRLSLKAVCENLGLTREEIKPQVHLLLCKGLIKQDSRDKVKWDQDDATYYTEQSKRKEIDGLIEK